MASLSAEHAESIARSLEMLRAEYNSVATDKPDARWKLTGNSNGVESSILQNTDSDFVTVRGRMLMQGIKPWQVVELVRDCESRTQWDDMLLKGTFAKNIGDARTSMLPPCSVDVIRLIYKGIPPISSRDLCLLRAWGQNDDGTCWLVAESCEDEAVPEDRNCVRAQLRECGYMCTPVPEGCEVVYISQTRFNGWIPTFVQNLLTQQQPQTLLKMYEVLAAKSEMPPSYPEALTGA